MGIFTNLFNPYVSEDKEVLPKETDERTPDVQVANDIGKKDRDTSSVISDIGVLIESVKEIILDSVVPFTGNDSFIGMSLWVNDEIYRVINKEPFMSGLRASFDSMHLFSLGNGEIKVIHGVPTPQDEASPLIKKGVIPPDKIWMRLMEKGSAGKIHTKALLSVFQGLGSCKEAEYTLGADDRTVYRIGRGSFSRKPGFAYRVNDIIIEDNNPDGDVQKLNNCVSSSQADIILLNCGFFLKAMPSGCRASGGSPTKIIRNQELIELRDSTTSYQLRDGDIIELGKSVLLLFKIIG